MPPILQLPFAHYENLSKEANSLRGAVHRQQMSNLLQAAGRILIHFAEALKLLFDEEIPDLEAAVDREDPLVELLPVVSLLTLQLNHNLDRIEQIIKDLKENIAGWDPRKDTDNILLELCGDFPGAVLNRHSYMMILAEPPVEPGGAFERRNAASGHGEPSFIANQYPPAPSDTNKPIRDGNNDAFIAGSFREAEVQNGDVLRAQLYSVLSSFWWRGRDIGRMPSKTLDPFVKQMGRNGVGVCQFCMEPYDTAQEALECVKQHIDM